MKGAGRTGTCALFRSPKQINAIMLSPIFKSANYHGYHTLNFEDVDPHFGSWNDYQELLDKAHDMGLPIFDFSIIMFYFYIFLSKMINRT